LRCKPSIVSIGIVALAVACTGCDKKEQNQTVPGLQEQAKVQQGQIKDQANQIEQLKDERKTTEQETHVRIEDAKKEFEDRLAKAEELHRLKVDQLESEIAKLRLELGSAQREKIALREINEREPRISAANSARKGYDLMVMGVLLILLIAVLLYVVFRYRSVHDRLNLLVMQQSSELRRIGANP
jgi:hypothetical protein